MPTYNAGKNIKTRTQLSSYPEGFPWRWDIPVNCHIHSSPILSGYILVQCHWLKLHFCPILHFSISTYRSAFTSKKKKKYRSAYVISNPKKSCISKEKWINKMWSSSQACLHWQCHQKVKAWSNLRWPATLLSSLLSL